MRSALVTCCLAVLCAGCATYTWQKPGVSPEQATADKQECDRQARLLANQYELTYPRAGVGGWRYPYDPYDPMLGFPSDRIVEEQRVLSACMRAKGYGLVKQEGSSPDQ